MGSTFYGLPCNKGGESFLLRTVDQNGQDRAILVDAAYSTHDDCSTTFEALQAEVPDLQRIDVAICTHEDADHSDGFPNLLKAWTAEMKTVGELWLPGRWALAFPAAAVRPKWSEHQIIKGAFAAASRLEGEIASFIEEEIWEISDEILWMIDSMVNPFWSMTHYGLRRATAEADAGPMFELARGDRDQTNNWAGLDQEHDERALARQIRSALATSQFQNIENRIELALEDVDESTRRPQSEAGHQLALILASSVLHTHDLILDIAATALDKKIPVRWFDYDEFVSRGKPAGGDPGFLVPVNSVEVLRTSAQPSGEMLAYALKLSQANVESLVFLRNGGHGEPPVLFSADSRLAQGMYSPRPDFPVPSSIASSWEAPIVTALHHGSKSNQHAYDVIAGWFSRSVPIYVRNGGKHVRHGYAPSFLSATRRTCVRCNGTKNPHRLIRIEAPSGSWQMPVHPVPCSCK